MRNIEPDAGELLVKALDLAVGASALARYATEHTSDARLRQTFRRFASTSAHQERALRQQLARTAGQPGGSSGVWVAAGYAGLALAALAALGLVFAVAARRWGSASSGTGASGAGAAPGPLDGAFGAFGAGRGVSSPR